MIAFDTGMAELVMAAGVPTIVAAVGYGMLRERTNKNETELAKKASNERVDALHETLKEVRSDVQAITGQMSDANEKLAVLLARAHNGREGDI